MVEKVEGGGMFLLIQGGVERTGSGWQGRLGGDGGGKVDVV